METERDQKEHVCKLCQKRFPSGKSLGGHMRSHVIASNSYASVRKIKLVNSSSSLPAAAKKDARSFRDGESVNKRDLKAVVENVGGAGGGYTSGISSNNNDDGGHAGGYGLRENPKKTWRIRADSSLEAKQERVCKQCGKGFQSLKALCGHMSSHSGKERNFHHSRWRSTHHDDDEDYDESNDVDDDDDDDESNNEYDGESWASGDDDEEEDLAAMESLSDNNVGEAEESSRQRQQKVRSKPKPVSYNNNLSKYKTLAVDSSSLANDSSSNNPKIGQEPEEVAMCLMMLSRDQSNSTQKQQQDKTGTGTDNGLNLTAESSDNNSLILEGGSPSTHVGLGKREQLYSKNSNIGCDISKNKKNNSTVKQMHHHQQGGRGYTGKKVKREEVNVEIDNSDSGYFENGSKELESDDSSVGVFAQNYKLMNKPELEFAGSGLKRSKQSSIDNYNKGKAALTHYSADEYYVDKQHGAEIRYDSRNRIKNGSNIEAPQTPQKGSNGRYQALGGHITTHNKKIKDLDTSLNSRENGSAVAANSAHKKTGSKKTKGHKCPFCPKVFRSGQALGGHKRSHLIGAGGAALLEKPAASPRVPIQQFEGEEKPLLDLNLPAPMEEYGNGNDQFVSSW